MLDVFPIPFENGEENWDTRKSYCTWAHRNKYKAIFIHQKNEKYNSFKNDISAGELGWIAFTHVNIWIMYPCISTKS